MATVALFDDFTDSVLGHHPDFMIGLANAAPAVLPAVVGAAGGGDVSPARLYCPDSYLAHRKLAGNVVHRPTTGRSPGSSDVKISFSQGVDPANVAAATRDAAAHGATVFLNGFFDENYPAWPAPEPGLRYVHTLHRPGAFAADATARARATRAGATRAGATRAGATRAGATADLAAQVRAMAPSALFVVHTRAGERLAARFIDPRAIVRTGWPAASRAEVMARFAATAAGPAREPYVLSIGGARADKGIDWLMAALANGPELRIVGQQYTGIRERLSAQYPDRRVAWETGWVSHQRLGEAIERAGVIVFPYTEQFAGYGGASGALGQALTYGKPVIVSEILADQVPASDACVVVRSGDVAGLRGAIDAALRDQDGYHAAAADLRGHVLDTHTYEAHLERILERAAVVGRV